ncbi:MAG: hypothetical protein ACE5JX_12095 [Acidobacteriota bacterium]
MEKRTLGKLSAAILALFFLSSLIQAPSHPDATQGVPHWRVGPIAASPPGVLSGDPPHYLVMVNSLIEDHDFDLSNNYRQALDGDWDAGARFRRMPIDRHVDRDAKGRLLPTHSPFFALLLAFPAWPFAGTLWVEPVCIWFTMMASLLGLALFFKHLPSRQNRESWLLALALATPLWCYSRDLWTEPWILAIWVAMLTSRSVWLVAALGLAGTLIKYPFAVVPLTMGLLALRGRERRWGYSLLASGVLGLAFSVAFIQWLFRDVEHFSLFHSGIHGGFSWPMVGVVGLLLGPENGILCYFPFLAWGLWEFRKGGDRYLPAVVFFLVHAAYQDWMGGAGFSSRYLVPVLPVMVWGVMKARPRGWFFKAALTYSIFWGFVGGFFPALVYDRTPWGAVSHTLERLARLLVGN